MQAVATFRSMLKEVPSRLAKLPADAVNRRSGADNWSAKEELGHLLDSAIMNHVRFLRVLSEDNPAMPGYDGVFCVKAHDYHDREWQDLVATWQLLNAHFLMAAEGVSPDAWKRPCTFEGKSVTLEFMFADYVDHALHHLAHIGIEVGDLETKSSARA